MDKTVVVIDDSPEREDRVEVAYAYPDTRAYAPSGVFAQVWILNEKSGDTLSVGSCGRGDTIQINDPKNPECGAVHNIPTGWLWRTAQPRTVKVQQKVTRLT